jgi:regulation of enolase protein 1 (concanavalin A-like superfamily)
VWNSNQEVEPLSGFGAKDVTIGTSMDGVNWMPLAGVPEFAQAPGDPNYGHDTTVDFGGVLAKYVKLTITSNWADGTKQGGLSEVRFFYVPVRARAPQPASGATGVPLDGVLNWRPGREAVRHDVYAGTDAEAVLKGTAAVHTVTTHSLGLGSLAAEYGRTYYWKVNEVNDAASPQSWEGDLWSFTTIGYGVVDDFEAYDDVCNRIFFSWVDGFGHSGSTECSVAQSAGNATGSTVGNVSPPFAEQTIVHSGDKSMPMAYDNTRAPFYSETQREWTVSQAWTGGGANTLVVYLRGDAPAFLETSPGTLLMNGTGTDIWNNGDQFRFAYKSLKGNGSIVARVENVSNTNAWAKAGVMIRETLQPGSAHALVVVTPGGSASFQRRTVAEDVSTSTDVAGVAAPYWVKLTRTGDTFTGQISADGVTWTDIAVTPALSITMANDVFIGLAVCSHDTALVCGARFSHVSTTGSVASQWQMAEVGRGQVNGNQPETFYVALQDNAGKMAVVSHPDPTVIATGNWEQWSIPLSQFTSGGVNVGAVRKMIIGVGDRGVPKAGGSGKLYIDDIRITRTGP